MSSRWTAAIRTTVLAGRDGVVRFLFAGPDCRMADELTAFSVIGPYVALRLLINTGFVWSKIQAFLGWLFKLRVLLGFVVNFQFCAAVCN